MEDFAARGKDVVCPEPHPHPAPPSMYALPPGAIDTHAHVIGPPPYQEARGYTPGPHPVTEYLAVLDACGLARGVLVQPTVHGVHNTMLLAALRRHPGRLRGIAVVSADIADRDVAALKEAGVTGLRLVAAASGGVGLQDLDRYEAICRETGWHLQLMVRADRLGPAAERLSRLRVPLVIDHLGYFPVDQGLASPGATVLLNLLGAGAWVKLSGAFRLSVRSDRADTIPIARACIEAAPDRCVWGSDWPHVNFWEPMPSMSALLDLLGAWAPEPSVRRRILVDNPARLYGFGPEACAD